MKSRQVLKLVLVTFVVKWLNEFILSHHGECEVLPRERHIQLSLTHGLVKEYHIWEMEHLLHC